MPEKSLLRDLWGDCLFLLSGKGNRMQKKLNFKNKGSLFVVDSPNCTTFWAFAVQIRITEIMRLGGHLFLLFPVGWWVMQICF